ncbi:MAG: LPS export ABC transporter periplasmic protein LptC [Armatimonadota bacterium]|nr:LPS export ABC transporter periplasmic protein LptC [Armatimonadota bacterium]MCX7776607.1 LPS export ABC transporter periplasmic protein LptC [Armatimonadota bacterium]MDW8025250.1 LPS export ABC transporter periplasmic protein LptC [Armatimonadota bacterium]
MLPLTIALLFCVWRLYPRNAKLEQTQLRNKPRPDIAVKFERIRGLKIRSDGETIWELSASVIKVNRQRTMTEVDGLKEAIYYTSGKPLLRVTAEHATWNMVTNDIEVRGNVTVRTEMGLQMRMERVVWRDRERILEIPCRVVGDSERLRFVTMRVLYMPMQHHLHLCDGVYANTNDAQFYCRQLDVNMKSGEYVAHPPVRLAVHIVQPFERFELKPMDVEALTHLIGIGKNQPTKTAVKDSKDREKKERKMLFESPTQPLKRVGRKIFGADVTVREEGEDYVIQVKRFTYDEEKEYLVADGLVRYEDPDIVLIAPRAELFRQERRVLLQGKVHLESRVKEDTQCSTPSKSTEEVKTQTSEQNEDKLPLRERIRRKPTVIECERVEYFYRERRAVATGNLRFKHGQYAGSADVVTYWHREDKLLAEGKVIVNDTEEGHIFECTKVTILLANGGRKEDEIIVAPGAKALLSVREEEETKEKEPAKEQRKEQKQQESEQPTEQKQL